LVGEFGVVDRRDRRGVGQVFWAGARGWEIPWGQLPSNLPVPLCYSDDHRFFRQPPRHQSLPHSRWRSSFFVEAACVRFLLTAKCGGGPVDEKDLEFESRSQRAQGNRQQSLPACLAHGRCRHAIGQSVIKQSNPAVAPPSPTPSQQGCLCWILVILTERLAGAQFPIGAPGSPGDADGGSFQHGELASSPFLERMGKLPKSDSFDHGHHLWCWLCYAQSGRSLFVVWRGPGGDSVQTARWRKLISVWTSTWFDDEHNSLHRAWSVVLLVQPGRFIFWLASSQHRFSHPASPFELWLRQRDSGIRLAHAALDQR